VGGKGLFVKEIEEALIKNKIDLAVHSLKDVPTVLPQELIISVIPKRENPLDALISREGRRLKELPVHARLGTSSLRRQAQLLNLRPDFKIEPLRGNLDTRIKKLERKLDGINSSCRSYPDGWGKPSIWIRKNFFRPLARERWASKLVAMTG
jgi:hydroxymethylbilane synthase